MSAGPSMLEIRTSWGTVTVTAENGKVTGCRLPSLGDKARTSLEIGASRVTRKGSARDQTVLKTADAFVRGIFNGRIPESPDVALPDGTDFQREIWKQLTRIKPGQTVTYGELTQRTGRPRASRAAGQACGANPVPLFIPCHRVVASNGRLGGFSSGLAWKKALLGAESALDVPEGSSRRRPA